MESSDSHDNSQTFPKLSFTNQMFLMHSLLYHI